MKGKKSKVRIIIIILGILLGLFLIGTLVCVGINWFNGQVENGEKLFESRVNSLVDERMAEYSNQGSHTPNDNTSASNVPNTSGNSTASIPDASDNFTSVTWPESSAPESTPSSESEKITATIANGHEEFNTTIFESYDDAFSNASVLPTGRNVNITLKANVDIENIEATASGLNPDSGEFDKFDEFSFESSQNSDNVYKLSFKVPKNPYGLGYKEYQVRFVAVFEIVTNEGTFYVSCAY